MHPIARINEAAAAPRAPRKIVFRIFQDSRGRWCAASDDGMVGGTFFARADALRFVRRETVGMPALVLHIAPEMDGLGNLALARVRPRG
jgi:hypothetical protein